MVRSEHARTSCLILSFKQRVCLVPNDSRIVQIPHNLHATVSSLTAFQTDLLRSFTSMSKTKQDEPILRYTYYQLL